LLQPFKEKFQQKLKELTSFKKNVEKQDLVVKALSFKMRNDFLSFSKLVCLTQTKKREQYLV